MRILWITEEEPGRSLIDFNPLLIGDPGPGLERDAPDRDPELEVQLPLGAIVALPYFGP
ncbi:MAG: hypothetical protein ACE5JP_10735 [Candidatus Bipolaricaulia bacterium]